MLMTTKVLKAVLTYDADNEEPGRTLLLKSGFDKQFIEVYEDPTELIVRHVSESDLPKGVVNSLKVDGHKLHMRHKKALTIDALDYPLVKVTKPLSMRGALKNDMLYGDEGEMNFHLEFYDYQPEDLEGDEKQ